MPCLKKGGVTVAGLHFGTTRLFCKGAISELLLRGRFRKRMAAVQRELPAKKVRFNGRALIQVFHVTRSQNLARHGLGKLQEKSLHSTTTNLPSTTTNTVMSVRLARVLVLVVILEAVHPQQLQTLQTSNISDAPPLLLEWGNWCSLKTPRAHRNTTSHFSRYSSFATPPPPRST